LSNPPKRSTDRRQARNVEAERKACEIRLRAERRTGQLLAEREMAKGAQGSGSNQHQVRSQPATAAPLADREMAKGTRGQLAGGSIVRPPENAQTLANLGISKTQSSRWQKLAAISDPITGRSVLPVIPNPRRPAERRLRRVFLHERPIAEPELTRHIRDVMSNPSKLPEPPPARRRSTQPPATSSPQQGLPPAPIRGSTLCNRAHG
jgi:hypothetical protein